MEACVINPLDPDNSVRNGSVHNEVIVCVVVTCRQSRLEQNSVDDVERNPEAANTSGLMFESAAIIHGAFNALSAAAACSRINMLLSPSLSPSTK